MTDVRVCSSFLAFSLMSIVVVEVRVDRLCHIVVCLAVSFPSDLPCLGVVEVFVVVGNVVASAIPSQHCCDNLLSCESKLRTCCVSSRTCCSTLGLHVCH